MRRGTRQRSSATGGPATTGDQSARRRPAENAIVRTDNVHNVVHLLTGLIALLIAFGLPGEHQANAVIGFGILYTIIFFAALVSPTQRGIFSVPWNAAVHLNLAVAVVSLAVGYMARGRASAIRPDPVMTLDAG